MSSKSQTYRRRADELVSNHSLTAFALEVSIPKKCSILQCNSFLDRIAMHFVWSSGITCIWIVERNKTKMKLKMHRHRIREIIKFNSILYTSRHIGMKVKTSMRYIFFNGAKFV
jgi:hypothetical protein